MLFDYLANRLNGPKAADADLRIELRFTNTKEHFLLAVKQGVLSYFRDCNGAKPQTTVTLTRAALNEVRKARRPRRTPRQQVGSRALGARLAQL